MRRIALTVWMGAAAIWAISTSGHAFESLGAPALVVNGVDARALGVDDVYPMRGDAPGSDPAGGARPRESRRLLTASVPRDRYTVRVYESALRLDEAVRAYDEDMRARGWKDSRAVREAMRDARSYVARGVEIVASFAEEGDGTAITLAELPAPADEVAP